MADQRGSVIAASKSTGEKTVRHQSGGGGGGDL